MCNQGRDFSIFGVIRLCLRFMIKVEKQGECRREIFFRPYAGSGRSAACGVMQQISRWIERVSKIVKKAVVDADYSIVFE